MSLTPGASTLPARYGALGATWLDPTSSECFLHHMTGPTAYQIPNPALEPFSVLIGDWTTVGSHPMLPGKTFHGLTTFAWFEGGAFLIMRSEIDESENPDGLAIFGSDDTLGTHHMLYFDERGVSRLYELSLRDNVLRWSRDAPGFAQRFNIRIVDPGLTMIGEGELSRDGATWDEDLALTYTRLR